MPTDEREFEVGKDEAWFAKIDREFEWNSDREFERTHGLRAGEQGYGDVRHKREEDTRAARDGLAARAAKQEEDTRATEKQLLDARLQFQQALNAQYLRTIDDTHAMTMQVIADNLQDARVARSVTYNVQMQKALDATVLEKVQDAVTAALKEVLGPPRGGVTPVSGGEAVMPK